MWKVSLLSCQDHDNKRRSMKVEKCWCSHSSHLLLVFFPSYSFPVSPDFNSQLRMPFALPLGKILQNSVSPPPRSLPYAPPTWVMCPLIVTKRHASQLSGVWSDPPGSAWAAEKCFTWNHTPAVTGSKHGRGIKAHTQGEGITWGPNYWGRLWVEFCHSHPKIYVLKS